MALKRRPAAKPRQSRREFLALAATAATVPMAACSQSDTEAYDEAAARLRAALSAAPEMREFVRYATLAANGHNAQPWRFMIGENGAGILPDFSRRTPVVDPDDHHLYVSLGCAAENFLLAAAAHGRPGAARFDNLGDGRIEIDLARAPAQAGALYAAIPARQSTRSEYDGRAVAPDELKLLEAAARLEGVALTFITDEARRETVLDFVIEGNSAQMNAPAFVEELEDWIRFNPAEAMRTGDGLFSGISGHPTMPTWLGRLMFAWVFKKDAETEKYRAHIRSSAGIAVFTGDKEDKDHWVRVGRSFQRFALKATVLGIRHAHINQPLEVPVLRPKFAAWLGAGGRRPDLVVRFGTAPPLPYSLRRPVTDVIV